MNLVRTYYFYKPEGEDLKKFELEKKVKNKKIVYAPYTLISPNLHIILKKNYIARQISKRHPNPKNRKKIGCKSKKWDPDQNSKNTFVL